MRALLLAAVLFATRAGAAPVDERAGEGTPLPRLGLVLDAGLPGGAGALLQARLLDSLRVDAGPMWSGIGFGVKGGVLYSPLRTAVAPTLELEGGWGVRADLSFLANRSNVPSALRPVLAHASYRYASALVGLDLGAARRVSFFVRAGICWLDVRAPRTVRTQSGGATLEIGDSTLRATLPAAKLGVQLWF